MSLRIGIRTTSTVPRSQRLPRRAAGSWEPQP